MSRHLVEFARDLVPFFPSIDEMGKLTHIHASRNNFPHPRFNWVRPDRTQLRCDLMPMDDQIDNELCRECMDRKKKAKREVKVLLLGQSESGKSTVLKSTSLCAPHPPL
jgi:predicted nucleic acid-binding Zn ribbon protein